jgi:protein involved in polysaccharide export with SLBB domain
VVERHLFRVYVTVQDTRGDTATVKGGTGTPGIYACTQAVAEALAGWRIAGLQGGGVLALIDRVPWRIARGESRTDVVRFAALATLPRPPR